MQPVRVSGGRFFFGWLVVAAAFLTMAVAFAVGYSFPSLFEPLSKEFGARREEVSLVFALTGLIYFGLGAITGPLTDRFGPRLLCLFAALTYAVGLVLASFSQAIWQVYLTYSLFVGLAVAAAYVPSVSTVQRWFVRRRGLASSLAVSGIGVGTLLGPQIANLLLQAGGWRAVYIWMGLGGGLLTLIAAWFLIRSPQAVGLLPDGEPVPPASAGVAPAAVEGYSIWQAIRTREYALIYFAMIAATLPVFMAIAHLVPRARDAGLSAETAAWGVSAIGFGSAFGRLLLGPLADRFGRRNSYAFTAGLIGVMMIWWLLMPADWVWALLVFGFLFGTAYGGFVALSPTVVADYFGARAVSGIIGVFYTGAGFGNFLGPWLAGRFYDATRDYTIPLIIGAVTALLAAGAIMLLGALRGAPSGSGVAAASRLPTRQSAARSGK